MAFVDLSGGRHDDATLAIGHKHEKKIIIDLLRRYRPPCNPHEVIKLMVERVRRYNVRRVFGDNYSAEFVAGGFKAQGILYKKSPLPKSQLYLELLGRLCSGQIELVDDETLVSQLASLERRTRSGGKDIVDHPQGGHDDLANAVAGVSYSLSIQRRVVGAFR